MVLAKARINFGGTAFPILPHCSPLGPSNLKFTGNELATINSAIVGLLLSACLSYTHKEVPFVTVQNGLFPKRKSSLNCPGEHPIKLGNTLLIDKPSKSSKLGVGKKLPLEDFS